MANNHLAAYLSDHLAGSVMAVDFLTQPDATHKHTKIAGVLEPILKGIARRAFAAKSPLLHVLVYRMFQTCLRSQATARTIPASSTKSPKINTITKTQSPRAARLDSLPA